MSLDSAIPVTCAKKQSRRVLTRIRVPLKSMPLIDMLFKRVEVDIVGPSAPLSEAEHRYILTLIDYPTRYPEAFSLQKNITETVVDALLSIYSIYSGYS